MTIICEEGLSRVSPTEKTIVTPTGCEFHGESVEVKDIVAVSIIRAGDSMLDVFMGIVPEASVGKILIQRNEETTLPMLYYSKLPPSIASKKVVLLDPMLGTGGSAKCAVKVLLDSGVKEENIHFFTVVSCPQGLNAVSTAYPSITIVTAMMDEGLNEKAYIVPGLGDFGDRFFGTEA
eukprot:CAMPEP_0170081442 /NCGR_PEP_ID=MMETSP0019_2-20121128/17304_1 /TAXON_ID=98059 /ORGANISM="Dinobryon sp., Strain UTEXLB2267" /LENGTH=177 /DNA_ID=CAMNT_0010295865 /DNA_START=104 /DNA_END=637 /DNA_ORIENTATION=-